MVQIFPRISEQEIVNLDPQVLSNIVNELNCNTEIVYSIIASASKDGYILVNKTYIPGVRIPLLSEQFSLTKNQTHIEGDDSPGIVSRQIVTQTGRLLILIAIMPAMNELTLATNERYESAS